VRVAGHATGDVVSISGPVRVTGSVDGDVSSITDRTFVGPRARVGGDLLYGDKRPTVAPGATVGGSIDQRNWSDGAGHWGWIGRLTWWLAVSVSTLLVGAVLLALAPRVLRAAEREARTHLGSSVGWGIAIAIALPVLAVLALVSLVGIPFGIALLLAFVPVLLIAYVTGAWIVGRRVVGDGRSPWVALLAGWAIVRVLALLPVAGALVGIAATVLGLGALVTAMWRARTPGAPAAPRAEPAAPGRPAAGPA
jgi:hypothetical protein